MDTRPTKTRLPVTKGITQRARKTWSIEKFWRLYNPSRRGVASSRGRTRQPGSDGEPPARRCIRVNTPGFSLKAPGPLVSCLLRSLLPAPCSLLPAPCSRAPGLPGSRASGLPGSWFLVPGSWFPVPSSQFPVPSSQSLDYQGTRVCRAFYIPQSKTPGTGPGGMGQRAAPYQTTLAAVSRRDTYQDLVLETGLPSWISTMSPSLYGVSVWA